MVNVYWTAISIDLWIYLVFYVWIDTYTLQYVVESINIFELSSSNAAQACTITVNTNDIDILGDRGVDDADLLFPHNAASIWAMQISLTNSTFFWCHLKKDIMQICTVVKNSGPTRDSRHVCEWKMFIENVLRLESSVRYNAHMECASWFYSLTATYIIFLILIVVLYSERPICFRLILLLLNNVHHMC